MASFGLLVMKLAVAVAFGCLVYALQPAGILPYDDDFGYVLSAVETVQKGRVWTNDWLEPWGASLSVSTAFFFSISGSMTMAVHGLLSVLSACSVIPLISLLERRRIQPLVAVIAAIALLSFPALLWKGAQFTSVAVCIPALMAALLAAEQRRWMLFTLALLPALAARQSSVAWLAIPAMCVLEGRIARSGTREGRWLAPLVVVVVGCAAYGMLDLAMNETYAQRVMTRAMWADLSLARVARGLAISAVAGAIACGLASVLLRCFVQDVRHTVSRTARLASLLVAAVLVGVFFWRGGAGVQLELPLRQTIASGHYTGVIWLLAVLGWAMGGFRIRRDCAAAALMAGLLASFRGEIWDYYLLDVVVLGFFGVEPCAEGVSRERPRRRAPWVLPMMGAALLCLALWQHWVVIQRVKRVIDGSYALTVLCEKALRCGRIEADALSVAPFGFQGWHLFPAFTQTLGKDGRYIADFSLFLRPNALRLETRAASAERIGEVTVFGDGPIVACGVFRVLWRETHEFSIHALPDAGEAEAPLPEIARRHRIYPLNDAEWRDLIGADAGSRH